MPYNQGRNRIKARYDELARIREPFLTRAKAISALTDPSLIPEDDNFDGTSDYPTPWQSVGPTGVSSFANKMGLAIFPLQATWAQFKLTSVVDKDEFVAAYGPQGLQAIETMLALREESIREYTETTYLRPTANEWFEQVQVSGNVLAYIPLDGGEMRSFKLNRFVVKRNHGNEVLEIIIKDGVRPSTLPDEVINFCSLSDSLEADDPVELYTMIRRDGDRWVAAQELSGHEFPEEGVGEAGFGAWDIYPLDACPYIHIRWKKIDGADYGMPYVESFLGDLYNLEVITMCLSQGVQISVRTLIGVTPGGVTDPEEVASAANGAVITADFMNDVKALQIDKALDLRIAKELQQELKRELSLRFRMKQGIQREGERVTATEIQELVQDLNENTGSVFALFMREVQTPVIKLMSRRMERMGKLKPIPDDLFDITIVTGLEALGRGRELQKDLTFINTLTQTFGPEMTLQLIHTDAFIKKMAAGMQYDITGIVKTTEELQQEREEAMQSQQLQMMSPYAAPMASVANKLIEQGGDNGNNTEQG